MDDWYTPSPYHWVGVYIGGPDRACSQPNLSASWITHNSNTGWGFAPLYVGRENGSGNSCGTRSYPSYIGSDVTTAKSQGIASADDAISDAKNLGFASPDVIYLDLENFDYTDSHCANIAQAYVNGWGQEFVAKNWLSGVYGSSCASGIDNYWTVSNPPFAIFGADTATGKTVSHMQCVADSHWSGGLVGGQRLKQFEEGHNETHGGDTLNIDSDCSGGPIDSNSAINYPGDDCS